MAEQNNENYENAVYNQENLEQDQEFEFKKFESEENQDEQEASQENDHNHFNDGAQAENIDGVEVEPERLKHFWKEWSQENDDIKYVLSDKEGVNVEFMNGTQIRDSGTRMSMSGAEGKVPDPQDFDKLVAAAMKKGWEGVIIDPEASEEFKQKLFQACARAGVNTKAYNPSQTELESAKDIAEENGHIGWGKNIITREELAQKENQEKENDDNNAQDDSSTGGEEAGDKDEKKEKLQEDLEKPTTVNQGQDMSAQNHAKQTQKQQQEENENKKEEKTKEKQQEETKQKEQTKDEKEKNPEKTVQEMKLEKISETGRKLQNKVALKEKANLKGLKTRFDNAQMQKWKDEYKDLTSNPDFDKSQIKDNHTRKLVNNAEKYGYDKDKPKEGSNISVRDYDNQNRKKYQEGVGKIKGYSHLEEVAVDSAVQKNQALALKNPNAQITAGMVSNSAQQKKQEMIREAIYLDEEKKINKSIEKSNDPNAKQQAQQKLGALKQEIMSGKHDNTESGKPRRPSPSSIQTVTQKTKDEIKEKQKSLDKQMESSNKQAPKQINKEIQNKVMQDKQKQ